MGFIGWCRQSQPSQGGRVSPAELVEEDVAGGEAGRSLTNRAGLRGRADDPARGDAHPDAAPPGAGPARLSAQLPSRFMTFLQDAHRRGVLRLVGSVYQYRHAAVL